MGRRGFVIIAVVVASGLGLTACANPGYEQDAAIRDLEDVGLTRAQAECVTRDMEDEFGGRRLNSRNPVTDEEYAEMVQILDRCEVDVSPEAVAPPS